MADQGKVSAPTVLVVEDNPDHMRMVTDLLTAYGLQVVQAVNHDTTFEALSKIEPDLILMDISLKGINGLSITKIIKDNPATKHIPVIILTAHAMDQDRQQAQKVSCDGFITKPIDTRNLLQQILNHITKK
ncbi:MAG: response regulator [Dethiobacteria bacterium]|jgi:two-component system cell cycle response regulator DivK